MAMPLFCLPLSHFSEIIRMPKVGFWRAICFFPECHRAGSEKSQVWAVWRRHAQGHRAKGHHLPTVTEEGIRSMREGLREQGGERRGNRQTKWGNRHKWKKRRANNWRSLWDRLTKEQKHRHLPGRITQGHICIKPEELASTQYSYLSISLLGLSSLKG